MDVEPLDAKESMKSLLLDGEFDLSNLPELGKTGTTEKLGELLERDKVEKEAKVE